MKNFLIAISTFAIVWQSFGQGTQLLRQPTISSTDIVFVSANDLWKVLERA